MLILTVCYAFQCLKHCEWLNFKALWIALLGIYAYGLPEKCYQEK